MVVDAAAYPSCNGLLSMKGNQLHTWRKLLSKEGWLRPDPGPQVTMNLQTIG